MYHQDPDHLKYQEKCGRISMEIEMLILDIILSALERINLKIQTQGDSENREDMQPF